MERVYSYNPEARTGLLGNKVGWLGFNGTFSTNRPYRAIKKIKVCKIFFICDRYLNMCYLEMLVKICESWELQ